MRGPVRFLPAVVLCGLLAGCHTMSGHVNNTIGTHHYRSGNVAEAARYFRMAAADKPRNADYLHNLGSSLAKQGQMGHAEQHYRQALEIDPLHQPSYHSLAALLKDQGRANEAHDLLAMWQGTQPYKPEPHIEMAWINRETGNHAAAEQNLRQALEADPTNSTALAHLGQVYQDQGRSGEAVAMYRRSLYQNWYQPGVKSRVAGITGRSTRHPYPNGPTMVAQPYGQFGQPQPVIVQNPAHPQITLMPPVPMNATADSGSLQPVPDGPALGSNQDPAHTDSRTSQLPTVVAH